MITKEFLESDRNFKFNSRLDNSSKRKSKVLFDKLFSNQFKKMIPQRKKELEIFLANLLFNPEKPVALHMQKNWWSRKEIGYLTIKKFKKILNQNGYLENQGGFNDRSGQGKSFTTRIWPTQKLKELFENAFVCTGNKTFELIELKTRKKRYISGRIKQKKGKDLLLNKSRLLPFNETGFTRKLRRELQKINRINKKVEIKLLHNGMCINIDVVVKDVFSDSFSYHGRLYANGTNQFQQFSKENRSKIIINGEEVIELDYTALHPHLLYAQEGIQLDCDPYTIAYDNPEVRSFFKVMLLTMVNSKGFNEAQSACNAWLNPEYVKDRKGVSAIYKYKNNLMSETGKQKFKQKCRKANAVKQAGIKTAKPLMEKFLEAHTPIRKYLCSGNKTGLKLMNKDAKIALAVCKYFTNKNIPILPVHDSFIVQARHKKELKTVMDKMFRKYANNFSCPVL